MVNLVKIKVEKSNNCRVILNSTKLEYISLREVENCSFINSIDSLKEMCINNVNNCVLPFVSFEKCLIRIEDSNDLYFGQKKINGFDDNNEEKTKIELIENVRSPMEFMGIGLTDFNKLITDCLIYPSKDYLNKLTKSLKFTMRTFQPQTRRVKVDGNEIQRISYQGENGVDLVISSKFYEENDDLEFTKTNKSESPFHSIIRYFEVEINIYSFISIGVVDSTEYEYGEDRHVGWDMYSIGYHSYDGALYIENSTHPIIKERKEKGKERCDKYIVGCGYNILKQEVFFTLNGKKIGCLVIDYQNISAAIGIGEFDTITINYGDSPFVFDYDNEIKTKNIQHHLKVNNNQLKRLKSNNH